MELSKEGMVGFNSGQLFTAAEQLLDGDTHNWIEYNGADVFYLVTNTHTTTVISCMLKYTK